MINAIILVPEITKGMKSIGSKSLLKIKNGQYIIQHQIEQLLQIHKKINITVATGFDNDKIIKAIEGYPRTNVMYNSEYHNTNFGKCLELYLSNSSHVDNLFIINSGILFKPKTFLAQYFKDQSKIFILDKPKVNFDIGCGVANKIEYLFYDLPQIWSECAFLNKQALNVLSSIISQKNISQMYIFEILNQLISSDIIFEKHILPKKNFLKISTMKDINRARIFA